MADILAMLKLRIPELVLGSLLTIAIFAMGSLFASQRQLETQQPAENRVELHAPEFTIFGVRIGEGLLVLVTLGLVAATIWLVLDGRKNAQRQLRAYISHQPLGAGFDQGQLFYFEWNAGQTPARDVAMFVCVKDDSSPPIKF
jgi:hypothetical protein